MRSVQAKWDAVYSQKKPNAATPAGVLVENEFLLPTQGAALDLACGFGANALFLAERGFKVSAWDISAVALNALGEIAGRNGYSINTRIGVIDRHSFNDCHFDVIVVSRFLDRTLTNAIIAALKVGGLLFYQTYTQTKATSDGPSNLAYLLAPQELLQLFAALPVIYYRDNALLGDKRFGLRNEAQFIGQKI